jgi:hypothetical protein
VPHSFPFHHHLVLVAGRRIHISTLSLLFCTLIQFSFAPMLSLLAPTAAGPAQATLPVAFTSPTMADWTKLQQDNALLQAALLALQRRNAQVAASQATTALQAAPAVSITLIVGVTTIDLAMVLPPPNPLLAIFGGAVNSGPVVPAPIVTQVTRYHA